LDGVLTSDRNGISRRHLKWPLLSSLMSSAESGMVNLEAAARGRGYLLKIVVVGADDEVVAAQCSLNDTCIDNVIRTCLSGERARRSSADIVKTLDVATGQQSGQLRLAAGSAPRLRNDRCRGGRHYSAHKKGTVPGPHSAFALVGCD